LPLFTAIAISPSSIIFWTVRGKLVVLLVYCFSSEGRGYIMNLSNAKVGYEMGADVFKRAIWNTGHCYIMNLWTAKSQSTQRFFCWFVQILEERCKIRTEPSPDGRKSDNLMAFNIEKWRSKCRRRRQNNRGLCYIIEKNISHREHPS